MYLEPLGVGKAANSAISGTCEHIDLHTLAKVGDVPSHNGVFLAGLDGKSGVYGIYAGGTVVGSCDGGLTYGAVPGV